MNRYILISDDDGHWYVCPADRQDEADKILLQTYSKMPNWLHPVRGSYTRVTFTDPEIFGKKVE